MNQKERLISNFRICVINLEYKIGMVNYMFDIDGTLTPSRLPIDKNFESFFKQWLLNKKTYLVTGSDKDKTIEQVGEKIWTNVNCAYQ